MQIIMIGTEAQQMEIGQPVHTSANITFLKSFVELKDIQTPDVVIDLLFEPNANRIKLLRQTGATVIINAVQHTLPETDEAFVRINGWPTFLKPFVVESAAANDSSKSVAEAALKAIGKEAEWLPDEPGFVAARVISSIINEAYFTLEEGISTKEAIDTAMKLGTNYPYGPFEWAQQIGLSNIVGLLTKLSKSNSRYAPCQLLLKEAGF